MDILRQFIHEQLLIEKFRSKDFDMKTLESIEGLHDIAEYARSTGLKQLGCGSSRCAFLLSSKWVLKVAINEKGLAQNFAEMEVYTNPRIKPIVAKVSKYGREYKWIISELVRPFKSRKELEKEIGIPYATFEQILDAYDNAEVKTTDADPDGERRARRKRALGPGARARAVTAPNMSKDTALKRVRTRKDPMQTLHGKSRQWMESVIELMKETDLLPGDLFFADHWGKTSEGRVVLLDYGFTSEVHKNFYKKNSAEPEFQSIHFSDLWPSQFGKKAADVDTEKPKKGSTKKDPSDTRISRD